MHGSSSIALALALSAATLVGGGERAPSEKEQHALVASYVALEGRSSAERVEQDRILAELERVPPLDAKQAAAWRKELEKLWRMGPKLERKSGATHLWPDEERGFYIVGGETKHPKGLFVGMHGGGLGSGDAWSAHGAFQGAASREDWLALFPEVLEKTERGWTDAGTEEFVLELVERALRTWDIDRDRVFFGGHSMGGYGTWTLGAHHADLVAGLAPSAGAPTPVLEGGKAIDVESGVVPNLRNVRLAVFQSSDDPRVPPAANRVAMRELAEARERWGGFEAEYWEVDGNAHELPPGGMRALLEKIHDARRQARPDTVVWEPTLAWKRQFYWLWAQRPRPGGLLVARLAREENAVELEGSLPEGLHVLLDDELLDLGRELVVRANGRELFRARVERSLAALVASGSEGDPARTFDAWIALEPARSAAEGE